MKKYIRLIGLILVLVTGFSLIACKKERAIILETNLLGRYKIKSVFVPIAVDLNKDGNFNNDLMLENKECVFDNTWFFGDYGIAELKKGEIFCRERSQEVHGDGVTGTFGYFFDKKKGIIEILHFEEGTAEIFKNVKLGYNPDQKQTVSYELWDKDIKQVVTYYLESIE